MNDIELKPDEIVASSIPPTKKKPGENQWLFFIGCVLVAAALVFNGYQLWRRAQLVNTPIQGDIEDNTALITEMIKQDEQLYAFLEAYQYVTVNSTLEPDNEALIDGAIDGMLKTLGDDYASYYESDDLAMKMDDRSGFYSGIGASVITSGGYITVVQPYENSPAKAAGLQTGDQILAVDGTDVVGWSTQDGIVLVRGEIGTNVVLTLRRPGQKDDFEVTITRALVETITVAGSMRDDGIATIVISSFNDQTGKQLQTYLEDFRARGMKGLILDLRSNGGGTHTGVVESAKLLVPEGKIFSITYANGYSNEEFSTLKDRGYPMVVLVNQYSASASEVLAGALQDSGVPLIGVQTYGKGVGQSSSGLSNGSGLTFTTSKWYTRDGRWVAGVGLIPDVSIVNPSFPLGVIENDKMKTSDLQLLQTKLTALGFSVSEADYGDLTKQTVAAYQASIGQTASGNLNLETVQQLNADCYALPDADIDIQWRAALETLNNLLED
jgi:carboxyl-terminal processing protease